MNQKSTSSGYDCDHYRFVPALTHSPFLFQSIPHPVDPVNPVQKLPRERCPTILDGIYGINRMDLGDWRDFSKLSPLGTNVTADTLIFL
jgi:hypothetical protein